MSNKNKNAFGYANQFSESKGLTKREYFAGLCLQGILAHSNISFGQDCDKRHLTSLAIKYADELLNQLENN